MYTTPEMNLRELDSRTNDGIEARLLWNPQTNRVWVTVEDQRSGELFELEVDAPDALAAFRHPYTYGRRVQRRIENHPLGKLMEPRF
jgi:hypothetical protein